jgi:hypothetical protein
MRQKLRFVVCGVIAIGIVVVVSYLRPRQTEWPRDLNHLVVVLLRESATNDQEHQSRFVTALSALARCHGVELLDYVPEEVSEGRAVLVEADHSDRVVVILRGNSRVAPGPDTQYLLLLDQEGHLLDRLSCAVTNTLTSMPADHAGIFRTGVLRAPAEDAAQSDQPSGKRKGYAG